MAKINGTNLRVYKDGNLLAYEREFTFSIETDLPDSSNKDSGGFAEHIIGQRSATLDVSAMVDFTADYGITEALNEVISRGDIAISWEDTTGTSFYAGIASYSSLSIGASNEDIVAWEGSITLNGTWTRYSDTLSAAVKTDTLINTWVHHSFGTDGENIVYYYDSGISQYRQLKNGALSNASLGVDPSDYLGLQSGKLAYIAGANDVVQSIKGGTVNTVYTFTGFNQGAYFVDGKYIYIATTTSLSKYLLSGGGAIWSAVLADTTNVFSIVKQNDHILISHSDGAGICFIRVYNEESGSFIRTLELPYRADMVWMAVDSNNLLYVSLGESLVNNSSIITIPYNTTSTPANTTTLTYYANVPVRAFKNEVYWLHENDIRKYVGGTLVNTYTAVTTNNARDFIVDKNRVAFLSDFTASQIKCVRL